MTEEEIPLIREAWGQVQEMIPESHREAGSRLGLIVQDDEDLTIRCIDDRACLFVTYEGDVAVCSIQKLHQSGRFRWPKPLSCHLFPIRVRGKKRDQLHFEHFSECAPAREAGECEETLLVDFLQDALTRAYGREFASALSARAREKGR